MSEDPIEMLEYETLVLSRHLAVLPGRSRRSEGVLDQSAYTLLTLLQVAGPASISQISAVTGLDASTLNRQTAALIRDTYAERIADPDGGIARKFRITTKGTRVLEEEREASRAALQRIVEHWDEGDRSALATLLKRLNEAIETRAARSWPRPT